MNTGTQQQHDRRGSDPRIEEILDGNKTILELLRKRELADALLEKRVEDMEIIVSGKDKEGGLVARVQSHNDQIKLATGGMVVLMGIGGFLGWCMDRILKGTIR